uniref:Uncharacterized protein n=1 Tax=Aegilops tauschii TaxID=37682 RepID=R7W3R1_AEGTA
MGIHWLSILVCGLYIKSADVVHLVESLHKLKHLRCLTLVISDISLLPRNIGKMKLLQFLDICGCENLASLSGTIGSLADKYEETSGGAMGRFVGRARHKNYTEHLIFRPSFSVFLPYFLLGWAGQGPVWPSRSSASGGDQLGFEPTWMVIGVVWTSWRLFPQLRMLQLDQLENVHVASSAANARLNDKMHLTNLLLYYTSILGDDGLGKEKGVYELSYLKLLQVNRAPCMRQVRNGFLQAVSAPFSRLNEMALLEMVQWDNWDWEEQLTVIGSPYLERITNFPNLHKLTVTNFPKLMVLESIPTLQRLVLEHYIMENLSEYMLDIKPSHFELFCRLKLLTSLAAWQYSLEWDKFSHVEHVKAYAPDGDNQRKWFVMYTRSKQL